MSKVYATDDTPAEEAPDKLTSPDVEAAAKKVTKDDRDVESAISIIYRYRNTAHYFLYECFNDELLERAVLFACVQFGCQLLIVLVETLQYRRRGLSSAMLLAAQSRLWEDADHSVTALIFAMCIYTSCFFVKHDGLALLHQLGDGLGKCA